VTSLSPAKADILGFEDYQLAAAETAVHPGSGNRAGGPEGGVEAWVYLALGLNGEAGEVAEVIKKALRDDAGVLNDASRDKLLKEMGDTLWYLARLADVLGFSLEHVALANLDKLRDRKDRKVLAGSGNDR
jgi:NTP pyrophosphatase (non-canonical NTP hydrolase)